MKTSAALLLAIVFNVAAAANNSVTVTTPQSRTVTVTAITDDIIKVSNTPAGIEVPTPKVTVIPAGKFTGTVTEYPGGHIISSPGSVTATVSDDGAVTISGGNGRTIEDTGVRGTAGEKSSIAIATTGTCSFYGAGERGQAFNLAGDTLTMYNRANYGYGAGDSRNSQMNICMPIAISSTGYALLFDDYAAAEMILSNPIIYTTESREPITYYFINSDGTLADLTTKLSELTGRQSLPPFWALGYITSRYGYRTQDETVNVVDSLQKNGYPLDGLVLDLYWYGKEQDMGRLAWEESQWPDHQKMLANLKQKGVNVTAISQPFVLRDGKGLDNFNDLSSKGLFVKDSAGNTHDVTIWVGNGGMFDVSNPDTRDWLSERYRRLTDEGITGWWGDLGEPEVHPATGLHANGKTAREYHNFYGNDWAAIIHRLFKEEYPDTRLFTLMRAGTTGLQRYSVFPWSSDVARTWEGMQAQVPIMLNSGLSGLGYMSHDVGGFAVDENNVSNPEMYVRWLQLGVFSPILRTHAQQMAEPYKYDTMQHLLKPLVEERYRWLPYNYTLAYENASQGLPLVRPLNFYSNSPIYDDIDDQYLWGRDVMVAPVMHPGAVTRRIVIPDGTWIDYNNPDDIYNGGDTIAAYPAPLATLPLFVRAGSFIPKADYRMKNTGDFDVSRYIVEYFPVDGIDSQFTMYEDDRQSPDALANGKHVLITFDGHAVADTITVTMNAEGSYDGAPAQRKITMVIHGIDARPASVTFNGRKTKSTFNAADKTLTVALNWNPADPATLKLLR